MELQSKMGNSGKTASQKSWRPGNRAIPNISLLVKAEGGFPGMRLVSGSTYLQIVITTT